MLFKEKKSLAIIGFCILKLDDACKSLKLMRLAISKKNHGYGYEGLSILLDYAFKNLNVLYFSLDVYEDNHVAIKLYEKVGLLNEGIQQDDSYRNRDDVNLIVYSMFENQYRDIK